MKLRYKIINGFLLLVVVALGALAIVLDYEAACPPAPGVESGATTMQAVVYRCYGSPEVMQLENVEKPVASGNQLLVKVQAAAVNPLDWHYLRGSPVIMRLGTGIGAPEITRLGVDFAGTVEAVGADVTRFKPGDAVFGGRTGAFAEYLTVREDRAVVHKPVNVGFDEAAAVPIAAITALQALRDRGQLKAGQKVLINGASGGVGTYAVQIAKVLGAEVTGVCSTRNVALVQSLGADQVIDYTKENFTDGAVQYDLIIDNVGNHPLLKLRKAMTDNGIVVMVGGPGGRFIGPLMYPLKGILLSPFVSQDFLPFLAELKQADLEYLGELMTTGLMKSVIDRSYSLSEVADAIRYSEEGRARGKIIVTVE
jgi:NADPH:quinone reductase-like Zn-dependent oxidoreductase